MTPRRTPPRASRRTARSSRRARRCRTRRGRTTSPRRSRRPSQPATPRSRRAGARCCPRRGASSSGSRSASRRVAATPASPPRGSEGAAAADSRAMTSSISLLEPSLLGSFGLPISRNRHADHGDEEDGQEPGHGGGGQPVPRDDDECDEPDRQVDETTSAPAPTIVAMSLKARPLSRRPGRGAPARPAACRGETERQRHEGEAPHAGQQPEEEGDPSTADRPGWP